MIGFKAFSKGFGDLWASKRLWIMVYALNIGMALVVAYPLKLILEARVGHSMDVNRSLERFNYTIVMDFVNHYGACFDGFLRQSIPLLLIYLIFSIFFNGGLVNRFVYGKHVSKINNFWLGCPKFFWRFFRLALYQAILYILILVFAWKIFVIGGISPLELESDSQLVSRITIISSIVVFLFILIGMAEEIIKNHIVVTDESFLYNPIKTGVRFFFWNFKTVLLLALLHFFVLQTIFWTYYVLSNWLNFSNLLTIGLVLSQIYIASRIGNRIWKIASVNKLIELQSIKEEQ